MNKLLEIIRNLISDFKECRRTIIACPLAFGEVSVKSRVKSVLHYKKPAFLFAIIALIVYFVMAIGFLTNPQSDDNNILYAVGKTGMVSIEEYVAEYNEMIFISFDEEDAKSMAEVECFKREALYQEALRLGYGVSNRELKENIEFVILTNFGGDEDFFNQFVEYIYESMDIYEQVHEKEMIIGLRRKKWN